VLGIGSTELLIIVVFAVLIFGPDKLPQIGRTIGRFQREFRKAQERMESTIKAEVDRMDDATAPSSQVKKAAADPDLFDEDEEEEDEEE
jgi:TatA/E family protein of Tat protein translocase